MSGELIKFLGSLLAVGALVAIASRLRLGGGGAILASEADARELADNAACGFAAVEVALDVGGKGAMLRDGEGRIMLLAPHGVHFAARILDGGARASRNGDELTVLTSDRAFPPTVLNLGNAAEAWARCIGTVES
jgi:hypothetical protein